MSTANSETHSAHRCPGCRLHSQYCLCTEVKPIFTNTQIVFIMHAAEEKRTSGSARLAHRMLSNSCIHVHGRPNKQLDLSDLYDDGRTYVLFPSNSARELTAANGAEFARPLRLIVPDGNWQQARKLAQRIGAIASLPRLRIPAYPPSRYRLRRSPHSGVLCTLEAVARALGVLEGVEVQSELERVLELFVERTMKVRRRGVRVEWSD